MIDNYFSGFFYFAQHSSLIHCTDGFLPAIRPQSASNSVFYVQLTCPSTTRVYLTLPFVRLTNRTLYKVQELDV